MKRFFLSPSKEVSGMLRARSRWIKLLFSRKGRAPRRAAWPKAQLLLHTLEARLTPNTYTVTNTNASGAGSLAAAIASANSNPGADTIDATGVTGTISLTTSSYLPTIIGSVTINGPGLSGGSPVLVVHGGGFLSNFHVFDIANGGGNPGIAVTLNGLGIEGGNVFGGDGISGDEGQGAGVHFIGATGTTGNSLTITNCYISGNDARATTSSAANSYGAGIYTSNVAFTMASSTVTGNFTQAAYGTSSNGSAFGGGIFVTGGSISISGSTISSNDAEAQAPSGHTTGDAFGGGIATDNTALTITDSAISGNSAKGSYNYYGGNATGGGLYHNGLAVTLTRVVISNNVALGGSVDLLTSSSVGVTGKGGAADGGGAYVKIPHSSASFLMTDSTVDGNRALGGSASVENDVNDGVGGNASHGGLYAVTFADDGTTETANATVEESTISSNSAIAGGANVSDTATPYTTGNAYGGNAIAGGVTVSEVLDSTIAGNVATAGDATRAYDSRGSSGAAYPGAAAGGGYGGDSKFGALPVSYSIFNSTIASNMATGGTGTLIVHSGGGTTTTVSQGLAIGGGMCDGNATGSTAYYQTDVGLYSTIVALNMVNSTDAANPVGTNAIGPDLIGGFSDGHNLIGYADSTIYEPNFVPAYGFGTTPPPVVVNTDSDLVGPNSNSTPFDPGFVLDSTGAPWLADFGGPTKTLALRSDSQALDAGEDSSSVNGGLFYDQRDIPYSRTVVTVGSSGSLNWSDGADVGAFERDPSAAKPIVYADRRWQNFVTGTYIADADPVAAGSQPATVGFNAFATVGAAVAAAAPAGGQVVVNGYDGSTSGTGVFSEAVDVKSGVTMTLQYGDISFNSLTIESGAAVTVTATRYAVSGDGFAVSVGTSSIDGFTSYGDLTMDPGTSANPTVLKNTGNATMHFLQGSFTHLGTPTTTYAVTNEYRDEIDLNGHDLEVKASSSLVGGSYVPGAVFWNDGVVFDSLSPYSHKAIADGLGSNPHGAQIKGSGAFQTTPQTTGTGYWSPGDCPGTDYFSAFTFGPGGVGDTAFVINNATGTAGPTIDANGQVSGWSLIQTGDFNWAADADHKLTVDLQTLANPTTVGSDMAGPMANFDPTQSYSWVAVKWTGTYSGPTDVAALNASTVFDTTAFGNSFNGTFSWSLDVANGTLSLTYTPAA
jgi:hypothetical protein